MTQTLMDRMGDSQVEALAWAPTLVLDGAPLLVDASIRNFQQGKSGYVADAVKQALLLPEDMVEWRSMRKHEVFLSLKRDFALVSPSSFSYYPSNSLFYTCTYILLMIFFFFFKGLSRLPIELRK